MCEKALVILKVFSGESFFTSFDIFEKTLVRKVNSDLFDPDLLMKDVMNVNAAGQLPEGINLSKMYNSRQHPKGIQMTIFGVTDCLRNMGKDWDTEIKPLLDPKKIGVFAGKIDYPKYKLLDKYAIKFIMRITKGPTDTSKTYEFTDWDMVIEFARNI